MYGWVVGRGGCSLCPDASHMDDSRQFTDRYGRTRVLGVVVFAPLISDFLTTLVFFFPDKFPGGYWFLVIAPIVEGILGCKSERLSVALCNRDLPQLHRQAGRRKQHICAMSRNPTTCTWVSALDVP